MAYGRASIFWIIWHCTIGVVISSNVYVKVSDDDGSARTWYQPFYVSPIASSQPHRRPHVTRSIQSAAGAAGAGLGDNTPDHCEQRPAKGNLHDHVALVSGIGDVIRLPCHYCDDPPEKAKSAHTWYKYKHQRVGDNTEWRASEVELDMHDDDEKNRVFIEPDHTLVIRDLKMADKGSYFCEEYNPKRDMDKKFVFTSGAFNAVSAAALAEVWESTPNEENTVDFMYHVDIEFAMEAVLVSSSGRGYQKPSEPRTNRSQNWQAMTMWGDWGECNVCGQRGERRRHGTCTITVIDPEKPVRNKYISSVLDLYPGGAACHSSLFIHMGPTLASLPEEVEVDTCDIPCASTDGSVSSKRDNNVVRRSVLQTMKKIHNATVEHVFAEPKVLKITYHKSEAQSTTMHCPAVKPTMAVQWRNGSTLLQSMDLAVSTNRRIEIDPSGSFVIHDLYKWDAGVISCSHTGYKRAQYTLIVSYGVRPMDPGTHLMYLYYSYACNAVLFFIILIGRHCLRCIRITRQRPQRPRGKDISRLPQDDTDSDHSGGDQIGQFDHSDEFGDQIPDSVMGNSNEVVNRQAAALPNIDHVDVDLRSRDDIDYIDVDADVASGDRFDADSIRPNHQRAGSNISRQVSARSIRSYGDEFSRTSLSSLFTDIDDDSRN